VTQEDMDYLGPLDGKAAHWEKENELRAVILTPVY